MVTSCLRVTAAVVIFSFVCVLYAFALCDDEVPYWIPQINWKVANASSQKTVVDSYWNADGKTNQWVIFDFNTILHMEFFRINKPPKGLRWTRVSAVNDEHGSNEEEVARFEGGVRPSEWVRLMKPTDTRYLKIFVENTYAENAAINDILIFGWDPLLCGEGIGTLNNSFTAHWQIERIFAGAEHLLRRPRELSLHPDGSRCILANEGDGNILVLDVRRKVVEIIVGEDEGLRAPNRVSAHYNKDGKVVYYISDDAINSIFSYTDGEKAIVEVVSSNSGAKSPKGIVHGNLLFVEDADLNSIFKLDLRDPRFCLHTVATETEGLNIPQYMAYSSHNDILYVVDLYGGVVKVERDNTVSQFIGSNVLSFAQSISVDSHGHIWVADNGRVPPVLIQFNVAGLSINEVIMPFYIPSYSLRGFVMMPDDFIVVAISYEVLSNSSTVSEIYMITPPHPTANTDLINGSWSSWSELDSCFPSCGVSRVSCKYRSCNAPSPLNGGSDCSGPSYECIDCLDITCDPICTKNWLDHKTSWNMTTSSYSGKKSGSLAFDNELTTAWYSRSKSNEWITISLPSEYSLWKFIVNSVEDRLQDGIIQTVDAWLQNPIDIVEFSVPSGPDGVNYVINFSKTTSQHWRIYGKSVYKGWIAIREIHLYGDKAPCRDISRDLSLPRIFTQPNAESNDSKLPPSREWKVKTIYGTDVIGATAFAITADEQIIVTNNDYPRLAVVDAHGSLIKDYGDAGTNLDLERPIGLAVDSSGLLWVADDVHRSLIVIASDGEAKTMLTNNDGISRPRGMVSLPGSGIAFGDRTEQAIFTYINQTLVRIADINDGITRPECLAVTSDGSIYVANDKLGGVVQLKLNASGYESSLFLDTDELVYPSCIFADVNSTLWVTDNGDSESRPSVKHFDQKGRLLEVITLSNLPTHKSPLAGLLVLESGHILVGVTYFIDKDRTDEILLLKPSRPNFYLIDGERLLLDDEENNSHSTPAGNWTVELVHEGAPLKGPDGMTKTDDEKVVIANEDAKNVILFDPATKTFEVLISSDEGLEAPEEVSINANGIYVTDDSTRGVYLKKGSEKLKKVFSTLNGLNSPEAIGVTSSGTVYVADEKMHQLLRSNGEQLEIIGEETDGIKYPEGMAFDVDDLLLLTDDKKGGVISFKDNKFSRFLGSLDLRHPEGVAFDDFGDIWFTDNQYATVEHYSADRRHVESIRAANLPPGSLSGIAVMSNGDIYVGAEWWSDKGLKTEITHSQLWKFSPPESPKYIAYNATKFLAQPIFEKESLRNIIEDPFGVIWDKTRQEFLITNRGQKNVLIADIDTPLLDRTWGSTMERPSGIAVSLNGSIYVTDDIGKTVYVATNSDEDLRPLLNSDHGLVSPKAIAVAADGALWVADDKQQKIFRMDLLSRDLIKMTDSDDGIKVPTTIVAKPGSTNGAIYVANGKYGGIYEVDNLGRVTQIISRKNAARPSGITVDIHDNIWVADNGAGKSRLVQFSVTGEPVVIYSLAEHIPAYSLRGIAIDSNMRFLIGVTYTNEQRAVVSELWLLSDVNNVGFGGETSKRAAIIGGVSVGAVSVIVVGASLVYRKRRQSESKLKRQPNLKASPSKESAKSV